MDPQTPTDRELVSRARDGDDDAFAMLYDRWWQPVCDVLGRMSLRSQYVEDCAQDTFVSAYEHFGDFNADAPDHAFRTWVFRTARRRAIDYPDSFNIRSLENDLAVAHRVRETFGALSPTFASSYLEAAAGRIFEDLSSDDRKRVAEELEARLTQPLA